MRPDLDNADVAQARQTDAIVSEGRQLRVASGWGIVHMRGGSGDIVL